MGERGFLAEEKGGAYERIAETVKTLNFDAAHDVGRCIAEAQLNSYCAGIPVKNPRSIHGPIGRWFLGAGLWLDGSKPRPAQVLERLRRIRFANFGARECLELLSAHPPTLPTCL